MEVSDDGADAQIVAPAARTPRRRHWHSHLTRRFLLSRSAARVPVLTIVGIQLAGCAVASQPGLGAPASPRERTIARAVERAWTQLESIPRDSSWSALGGHFTADAAVVTAAGRVPVDRAGENLRTLRIERLSATPTRQQYCANGMREIGNYAIHGRGVEGQETMATGPYVVRWIVDDSDVARIDRLLLYGSATLSLTDVPCSPLVASRFRRAVVFVTPWTGATLSQTQSEMTKGGKSVGWTTDASVAPSPVPGGSVVGGSAALATALVGMRVRVRSHWLELATQVGHNASEQRLFHPDYRSLVSLTARASQTYALASTELNRIRLGAGPALVTTDWISSETLFDRTLPPDVLPERTERSHTTRAIGGVVQGSFAIDLLFDNVLETIVQFRFVPAVHTGSLTIFPGTTVRQNALMIGASLGHAF